MGAFDEGIQSACYCAAILDKTVRVEDLAERLGISAPTLYEWLNSPQKLNTPLKIVRNLFALTTDGRLKKFLEPEGWQLVRVKAKAADLKATLEYDFGSLHVILGQFHNEYRRAKSPESPGGRAVTPQEVATLEKHADQLRSQLEAVELVLRGWRGDLD